MMIRGCSSQKQNKTNKKSQQEAYDKADQLWKSGISVFLLTRTEEILSERGDK